MDTVTGAQHVVRVFSRLGSESRSFSLFHVVVLEKRDKHISETFVMLGHNNKILSFLIFNTL